MFSVSDMGCVKQNYIDPLVMCYEAKYSQVCTKGNWSSSPFEDLLNYTEASANDAPTDSNNVLGPSVGDDLYPLWKVI